MGYDYLDRPTRFIAERTKGKEGGNEQKGPARYHGETPSS